MCQYYFHSGNSMSNHPIFCECHPYVSDFFEILTNDTDEKKIPENFMGIALIALEILALKFCPFLYFEPKIRHFES